LGILVLEELDTHINFLVKVFALDVNSPKSKKRNLEVLKVVFRGSRKYDSKNFIHH